MRPTKEEALAFALMLAAGMPGPDAIGYFLGENDPPEMAGLKLKAWMKSKELQGAIREVNGAPWQDLTLEDRIKFAVNKTYSEMAYYLYSRNYVELTGNDKQKADTCRQALEAKLSGMAGKMDALSQFWSDLASGKVALKPKTLPAALPS